jgi:creatinine amidohydrolase
MLRPRVLASILALATACATAAAVSSAEPESSVPSPIVAPAPEGRRLGTMTWPEAEQALTPDTVVVIPLGAAAKEHGPHLLLRNDEIIADYYAERVRAAADVVIAPTVGFHFYPAFADYPGSITLREDTARDLVVDICRSLAAHGPRRFYVLNTGISTVFALKASAEILGHEGIALRFTDIETIAGPVQREVAEQPGGTHADEVETSIMLYIAPEAVDMSQAVRDYAPKSVRGFSRSAKGPGHHSKTGIWGDPTLATRDKGRRVVEAMVEGILAEIEALRATEPPPGKPKPATAYPFGEPL